MERSNTHPITHEQQTIKAGSIDWNAVITSLQQTINNLHITRGYRDDRISELGDRVELLEKKLLEVGIKVDDDAHLVDDEEEEEHPKCVDIEYDCPKCGINRGKHDVSKHNRLIPCESDGEDDEEEEEEHPKCVDCDNLASINKYYPNDTYCVSSQKYWTLCEECFKKDQEDEEEEDEDDWEDITHCSRSRRHCHLKYTKKNNIVSTKLQMAGGGSHAWWYVLNWDNPENEPDVYIKTLNELTHTQKTLILRKEQWGQSVKLVEFDSDLREENDEYQYHRFTITDDLYDAVEEEEEED